jgi:subtilisin family serine protease
MRRLLSFLLVALAFVGPAAAAERTLITPLAPQATLSTTPAAAAELGTLSQAATAKGHIKVIVGLRVPFAPEASLAGSERLAQRRDIAAAAGLLRSRFAAAVTNRPAAVRSYSTLPFVALDVTPDELRKLAADPLVISISENIKLRGRLAESAPLIRAPQAWAAGFTGAGQTIAIIDSGIDKTHPFLAGKVVSEACYSQGGYCAGATSSTAVGSGVPCPRPYPCAHGTHVAGIAAGVGPSASGIAKGANLISIQVFSPDPDDPENIFAWYSDVLAGLNRVAELRGSYNIAAVNLSLGGSRAKRSCDSAYPAMTAAIANLQSAGIATVIASGNEGWKDAIAFPACISKAVSVGAVSDGDVGICGDGQPMTVDKVACYSNGASFLSLLAPGSLITSSVPGGGYESWDGTSMATPHVAGA